MKKIIVPLLSLVVLSTAVIARAEDINDIFKRVNDLVTAKNYSKALTELSWATKEIEKMNTQFLQSFFPDQLAGYTGKKTEANNALGMMNLEREYTKTGDKASVRVSLAGGSGSGATAGLGGLAAFGRMAAMMGGQGAGHDTVRIAGRTATMEKNEDGDSAELTVFLDSGSILTFKMSNGSNTDALKTMADALDVNKLDNYLRGQS